MAKKRGSRVRKRISDIISGSRVAKLNPNALGLAFGVVMAISMLLLSLMTVWLSWGGIILSHINLIYLGYDATIYGSVIGALWGFVDGFICGYLVAWLYNKFSN